MPRATKKRASKEKDAGPGALAPAASSTAVHRCRVITPPVSPVTSMAFDYAAARLAVARESGAVEIWSVGGWHITSVIPARSPPVAVTSVVWTRSGRLVTAGLDAVLCEWDLATLQARSRVDTHGGVVECLAASKTTLAAGCEDGVVRLYVVDEDSQDGLKLARSFSKVDGRILSLAWHRSGRYLVTGSSDGCIRRWDVATGRPLLTITVENYGRTPTSVWDVAVLRDDTIVSVDSQGNTQFWDGQFGTLVQGFHQHQAPVLALAVDPTETIVWSAGVDNMVAMFRLVAGSWVYSSNKRPHTHDVLALAVARRGNVLVSAGVDAQLVIHDPAHFAAATPRKRLPLPETPPFSLAAVPDVGTLLSYHTATTVQLWRLADDEAQIAALGARRDASKKRTVAVGEPATPEHVLDVHIAGGDALLCSALSPDGRLLLCSTVRELKAFEVMSAASVSDGRQHFRARAVELGGEETRAAHRLRFTPDGTKAVAGSLGGMIDVYSTTGSGDEDGLLASWAHHRTRAGETDELAEPRDVLITHLAVSEDGQWLATADADGSVHVFNMDSMAFHSSLPRRTDTSITSVAVHPTSALVVVAYATNELLVYDVERRQVVPAAAAPEKLTTRWDRILGTSFAADGSLLLASHYFLCFVDLDAPSAAGAPAVNMHSRAARKRRRLERAGRAVLADAGESNYALVSRFQQVQYAAFVPGRKQRTLLVVEAPWLKVLESLPETYSRPRYGT